MRAGRNSYQAGGSNSHSHDPTCQVSPTGRSLSYAGMIRTTPRCGGCGDFAVASSMPKSDAMPRKPRKKKNRLFMEDPILAI